MDALTGLSIAAIIIVIGGLLVIRMRKKTKPPVDFDKEPIPF